MAKRFFSLWPAAIKSPSTNPGATICLRQSLVSTSSAHWLFWQAVSPGGKKTGLQHDSLQQQSRKHFGLHPPFGRGVVAFGHVPGVKQALEPLEIQLDLPAVVKFPRFSGQAGRRGSRKDIHHAQDPSDLGQRLPSGSRQPPDQQPAPLEGGGGRTWSLGRLAADLASSSAPPRARSAGRKVVAESPWWSRPAEIRRLQRENEYLRRQREILKKAMSILSEVPQSGMT